MSRVVHFEVHASNPESLISFYEQLFGWSFTRFGEMEYWTIETGPKDQMGINGGLLPRRGPKAEEGQPVNSYVCTVGIGNLDETFQKALSLGAEEAVPKMEIPGVGWLSYIKDPDGNILGLLQPDKTAP